MRGRAMVGLAGCVVLFVSGVATAPADAAFPGRNGAVAFVGRRGGQDILYLRAGRARVRSLLARGTLAHPVFSPLGRRIAFDRASSVGRDIYVMNADGSDLRRLTAAEGREAHPTWSPAGDRVAFAAGPLGHRRIEAVGADGNGRRPVTSGPGDSYAPAWSSRGDIAFVHRNRGRADLYVLRATGRRARRLTHSRPDESSPAWSPDGSLLAFVRGGPRHRDIWVMTAEGTDARRVTSLRGPVDSPAWSPDGRSLVFSMGPNGHRRLYSIGADGRRLAALTLERSDGRFPDWQPSGGDPVIAAAGDVACDPGSVYYNGGLGKRRRCGQLRTSNLLLRMDLWSVLVLGDTQYERGELANFQRVFNPTWGRLIGLIHPVVGNHEYSTPQAAGYFDYFDGPGNQTGRGGPRGAGYYSFDIGTWHVVALNSNCRRVPGGCGPGSPQETWLRQDLAAHPARCTLAFWHHPRFSSGGFGDDGQTQPLWQALYDAGADVVLTGHEHFYERFLPLDPTGAPDPARGLVEFTVGTGGKSIVGPRGAQHANSAVLNATTFGVLKLTLHPDSYDWEFAPASADPFRDSGSAPCH